MKSQILNIGHRGAKGHLAENTLESIKKALEMGVDGIEIDVHKCASGELVVFHDFTLDRMTNGSGEVSKQSLSQLKQLKVLGKYEIPTLIEVLDLIAGKYLINIELKGKNTALGTFETVMDYVQNKSWKYNQFLVSSFQQNELQNLYNLNKNIPLAVLTKASVSDAIQFALTVQAHAIHPNFALVTMDNVKAAHEKGLKVNTWTVNEKETIERMKSYGVDGIISDFPNRF